MTRSRPELRETIARTLALLRAALLRRCQGVSIGPGTRVSWSTRIDRGDRGGLRIGAWSELSHAVALLVCDPAAGCDADIVIGDCTFIGARTIVYPGIRIGDHCIIAPGSVVMNDIPSHSIAAGNPARIIRANISTGTYGVLDQEGLARSRRYGALEIVGGRDDDQAG